MASFPQTLSTAGRFLNNLNKRKEWKTLDDTCVPNSVGALANSIDGALRGRVGGKRHEIGGHDSADRAFGIIDQLANCRLALRIEQRQNFFAAMVGQAINKRDCIVGGRRERSAARSSRRRSTREYPAKAPAAAL